MRVHGLSASTQDTTLTIAENGRYVRISPSLVPDKGSIFFAIPTPSRVDDRKLQARSVVIHYRPGANASIKSLTVFHEKEALECKARVKHLGTSQFDKQTWDFIKKSDTIKSDYAMSGLAIRIDIGFVAARPKDAWIDFYSAGIDFE